MNRYGEHINYIFKWQVASTLLVVLFQIVGIVLVGRFLDLKNLGIFTLFQIVFRFGLLIFDPGMFHSIVQRYETSKSLIKLLYRYQLGIVSVLLILMIGTYYWIIQGNSENNILLILSIFCLVGVAIGSYFHNVLILHLKQDKISYAQILSYVLELIALLLLLNYVSALLAFSISLCIRLFIFYLGCFIFSASISIDKVQNESLVKTDAHVNFGLYHMLNQGLSFLQGHYDTVLLTLLFGLSVIGPYNLSCEIGFLIFSKINPIFNKTHFPIISKARKEENPIQGIISYTFSQFLFILIPLYILFWANADWILTLAFGAKAEIILFFTRFILVVAMLKAINNMLFSYIMALGESRILFFWNVAIVLINYMICLIFFWIRIEMHTFLWFSMAYSLVVVCIMLYILNRKVDYLYQELMSWVPKFLGFIVLFSFLLFIVNFLGVGSWIQFVLGISLYALLFYLIDKSRFLQLVKLKLV
ncbi:MAG: oligosaccharide flippase family protein [Bacteroidota bacterium]|nr:oligosaccharide flippase family protein [Bacteroidota bacterium]